MSSINSIIEDFKMCEATRCPEVTIWLTGIRYNTKHHFLWLVKYLSAVSSNSNVHRFKKNCLPVASSKTSWKDLNLLKMTTKLWSLNSFWKKTRCKSIFGVSVLLFIYLLLSSDYFMTIKKKKMKRNVPIQVFSPSISICTIPLWIKAR